MRPCRSYLLTQDAFVVVAPQLPHRASSWKEHQAHIAGLLDATAGKDRRNVYIIGFSKGGRAAFQIANPSMTGTRDKSMRRRRRNLRKRLKGLENRWLTSWRRMLSRLHGARSHLAGFSASLVNEASEKLPYRRRDGWGQRPPSRKSMSSIVNTDKGASRMTVLPC